MADATQERAREILAARQALELATRLGCGLCREGHKPERRRLPWASDQASFWAHGRTAPQDETFREETYVEQCGCPAYLHDLLDRNDDDLFTMVKGE